MKDMAPDMQAETPQVAVNEQKKRSPIAVIGVIVVLVAIVYGVWQLAHLIGR